jgi:ribonuclease HI
MRKATVAKEKRTKNIIKYMSSSFVNTAITSYSKINASSSLITSEKAAPSQEKCNQDSYKEVYSIFTRDNHHHPY